MTTFPLRQINPVISCNFATDILQHLATCLARLQTIDKRTFLVSRLGLICKYIKACKPTEFIGSSSFHSFVLSNIARNYRYPENNLILLNAACPCQMLKEHI